MLITAKNCFSSIQSHYVQLIEGRPTNDSDQKASGCKRFTSFVFLLVLAVPAAVTGCVLSVPSLMGRCCCYKDKKNSNHGSAEKTSLVGQQHLSPSPNSKQVSLVELSKVEPSENELEQLKNSYGSVKQELLAAEKRIMETVNQNNSLKKNAQEKIDKQAQSISELTLKAVEVQKKHEEEIKKTASKAASEIEKLKEKLKTANQEKAEFQDKLDGLQATILQTKAENDQPRQMLERRIEEMAQEHHKKIEEMTQQQKNKEQLHKETLKDLQEVHLSDVEVLRKEQLFMKVYSDTLMNAIEQFYKVQHGKEILTGEELAARLKELSEKFKGTSEEGKAKESRWKNVFRSMTRSSKEKEEIGEYSILAIYAWMKSKREAFRNEKYDTYETIENFTDAFEKEDNITDLLDSLEKLNGKQESTTKKPKEEVPKEVQEPLTDGNDVSYEQELRPQYK